MAKINIIYLERLKNLTLAAAGIKTVTPDECGMLCFSIYEKTRLMISEDALKRFFGFSIGKFEPSAFTLNALAMYCGYESWEAFPKLPSGQETRTDKVINAIAEDPLIHTLLDTSAPSVILNTNAPDFTILTYNKAFETVTYTQSRQLAGLSWWDAFNPEKAGGKGPTQLLEAFREAMFSKQTLKLNPLQYNIPCEQPDVSTVCWWNIKIVPVNDHGFVKQLLLYVDNITDKIIHQDAIEEAIMKELTMAENLAITNVKLNTAIKSLGESHEELLLMKKQLEEANSTLEKRVFERTKKLFESEATQRGLIDNAPVAIGVLMGPEHIVETANKKIIEYWGKDDSVINKPLAVALPELQGQPFIGILDEVRHSGHPYVNPELCAFLDINGSMQSRYFDMVYHPIQHSPGVTDRIFIVAVDITAHVNAMKKLQQSESMLRLAVTSANIGTWVLDPINKNLSYNAMFTRILGWDRNEPLTYELAMAQVTDDFRAPLQEFIANIVSGAEQDYDFTYTHKKFNDGKIIWLRGTGKLTSDDSGQVKIFSGIIREITEEIHTGTLTD